MMPSASEVGYETNQVLRRVFDTHVVLDVPVAGVRREFVDHARPVLDRPVQAHQVADIGVDAHRRHIDVGDEPTAPSAVPM